MDGGSGQAAGRRAGQPGPGQDRRSNFILSAQAGIQDVALDLLNPGIHHQAAAREDGKVLLDWRTRQGQGVFSMTIDDIRKRLTGGFVPFTLRTSDGEEFVVPHREFIFLTARRVVVADRKGYVNVLDPLHIVSIEEPKVLLTK